MAKPRFNRRRTLEKAWDRAHEWATTGRNTAVRTHDQAPRAGRNLNRFGLRRSAPGDPPAEETGQLMRLIQAGLRREGSGSTFVVNYQVLEDGYSEGGRVLEPRPLGRITVSELKSRRQP